MGLCWYVVESDFRVRKGELCCGCLLSPLTDHMGVLSVLILSQTH